MSAEDRRAQHLEVLERRLNPRKRVHYRMDVTDGSGVFLGCVVDVSLGGMRVRCGPDVDLPATSRVRIVFPRWLDLGEGLDVSGRFVWLKPGPQGGTEAGFAFDELRKKQDALLTELLDRLTEAEEEDREEPAA